MTSTSPLPDHLWNNASPELRSAILALVQIHQEQVAALQSRVNDLEARLKLNSTNSHKPPSSDFLGAKRKPPAPPTGKKRGGQPKHRKAHRALVPPQKVRQTITCNPTRDVKSFVADARRIIAEKIPLPAPSGRRIIGGRPHSRGGKRPWL